MKRMLHIKIGTCVDIKFGSIITDDLDDETKDIYSKKVVNQ